MATSPTSPLDTSSEVRSKPEVSDGVPSLSGGRGRLLPPFLSVPTGAGGMAGNGHRAPCHILGRGVLEFSQQGYIPPGGGVEADFRHNQVIFKGHSPPLTRRLSTRGGLLFLVMKEASAPCNMYPYHRMLCNIVI